MVEAGIQLTFRLVRYSQRKRGARAPILDPTGIPSDLVPGPLSPSAPASKKMGPARTCPQHRADSQPNVTSHIAAALGSAAQRRPSHSALLWLPSRSVSGTTTNSP